jgi:hypothetical protein
MAVIKRQQHNLKLAQVLNNMLQCGSLVDVTIYCDDGQVNAHKLVLAASSTYFRNLFSRMTNAFQYPIIVLREMPVDDLKTIIQFVYHGEVNVPQNRVESLMRCANYLQIDGMASSANSLNAILASSSTMSASTLQHQPLLTSSIHPLNSTLSATSTNIATTGSNNMSMNSNQVMMNKSHTQYPPALTAPTSAVNSKQSSRGQNRRSNNSIANAGPDHSNSSGKPRHTCPVCLKTFTHGFTLKRHMELHSNSRLTIFCEVCSKSYSCKDSYLRHKKSSGHLQHADFHHVNTGR